MTVVAFDTETYLIEPGLLAPPLVCMAWWNGEDGALLDHEQAPSVMRSMLDDGVTLVGHNVAYDFAVLAAADSDLMPAIFEAYKAGRIYDTRLDEKLIDIEKGRIIKGRRRHGGKMIGYSLADCIWKRFDHVLDKDTWRTGYAKFRGEPLDSWPEGAREYAADDAKWTYKLFADQGFGHHNGPDQARAAWALHLASVYGLRVDGGRLAELECSLTARKEGLQERLLFDGFLKWKGTKKQPRRDGVAKDLTRIRAAIAEAYDGDPPRSEKGNIKTTEAVIKETSHDGLKRVAEYTHVDKMLGTYVAALSQGTNHPLNPRFNPLVETGRTSCAQPNLQNIPRSEGLRECFVPRAGNYYVACDYDTLELRVLASVCESFFGSSAMARAFRDGLDPHLLLGADLLGLPYKKALELYRGGDQAVKDARQFAKVANFGFPGGLGPQAFVHYAKAMAGITMALQEATRLRDKWFATWPEMREYFRVVGDITAGGEGWPKLPVSKRVRGRTTFTETCNYFFQGTAADGAKASLFAVAQKCYVEEDNDLYGCRVVNFVHDEIMIEAPTDRAALAADELAKTMCRAMQPYCGSVPVTASPVMMERWYKDAETVRDENGRLVLWTPS